MRLARRGWMIAALAAACASPFVAGSMAQRDRVLVRTISGSGLQEVTLLSKAHRIDRLFGSMQGPFSRQRGIRLLPGEEGPVWITRVSADVVSADGSSRAPSHFFCHANLVAGGGTNDDATRLVTLVPGRMSVRLPPGFGIPVPADEALEYFSMSLNLREPAGSRDIRFRTKISFVRDAEARRTGLRPLAMRAVYGYEPLSAAAGKVPFCTGGSSPGAACGPFSARAASRNAFIDSLGRTNTVHWFIPPGRYDRSVPVDIQLDVRRDITVHYVTAHLHPGGRSVALVDTTAKRTVFEIGAAESAGRGGIARMGEIAFPDGVTLHRDHEYELRTVYENGSAAPVDAMSILYLYCLDEPAPAEA